MKKIILILFVSLFLFGCYDKPPKGYVWQLELNNGQRFRIVANKANVFRTDDGKWIKVIDNNTIKKFHLQPCD